MNILKCIILPLCRLCSICPMPQTFNNCMCHMLCASTWWSVSSTQLTWDVSMFLRQYLALRIYIEVFKWHCRMCVSEGKRVELYYKNRLVLIKVVQLNCFWGKGFNKYILPFLQFILFLLIVASLMWTLPLLKIRYTCFKKLCWRRRKSAPAYKRSKQSN